MESLIKQKLLKFQENLIMRVSIHSESNFLRAVLLSRHKVMRSPYLVKLKNKPVFSKIKDTPIITYIDNYARTSISTTLESLSICLHEEVVALIMIWVMTTWKSNHRSLIHLNQLGHWGSS